MAYTHSPPYLEIDLEFYRGATFTLEIEWADENDVAIDLTGCTAELDVRETPDSDTELFEASTADYITITGASSDTLLVTVPAAITAAFEWECGVYDLLVTFPDGTVVPAARGSASVIKGVTR